MYVTIKFDIVYTGKVYIHSLKGSIVIAIVSFLWYIVVP